jgi:hypothetical protein
MSRRFLVPLVSVVALAFAILPVGAAAAPLDASSVWTAQKGSGGPVTPPDANGDSFGGTRDGGSITGAFNGLMGWNLDFVLHTTTGVVDGAGMAVCDPCTVAGLTGNVSFTLTWSGHGSLINCGGTFLCAVITGKAGTWNITGATGALVGIAGAGAWTEAFPSRFLTGSIFLPGAGDQPITASGTNISATEGQAFNGAVASFNDPDPNSTLAEYAATIQWGDGSSTSAGVISKPTSGPFTVGGSHTYAEEGSHSVTVTVTDSDNTSNIATASSTANVTDAALTASAACAPTSTQSYNGPTATFADAASPHGTLTDFSATINWGDGSSSTGNITAPNGGPYTVSGSHHYATTGNFTITTIINDVGGSHATTNCRMLAFAFPPGGGSFLIGGQNSANGTAVTFWSARWAKDNSLTGGFAPYSFKGFAENPTTPRCGAGWSSDPGNSTPPPAGPLPAFMAVIVTSSADQSGSTISGNIVHIVVVQTNPGYSSSPGHAGTGAVIAVVC